MTQKNKPIIFYTSGSTGEPKTITKNYECLYKEAKDMADFFKLSKDTIIVSTVNHEHMFGYTFTVMLPEVSGCSVYPERIFYPEDLKDFGKYVFVTTPSFLDKLAKYNFQFKRKPTMIITAGANINDEVFKYFEKICPITDVYGSSETGVIAYRHSYNELLRPFDNVKVERKGESVIVKSEYFLEPEFVLNDDLEFCQNGFRVNGRKDRIVKIQEKRISLDVVESYINKSEYVDKSHCLQIEDKLCAAVVLNEKGRHFLVKHGKLDLVKILQKCVKPDLNGDVVHCKRWRFLPDFPLNKNGKTDGKRILEIFNTNLTYPYVVDFFKDADRVEFSLIFPHESNFFKGHFTDFPIVPGVVQLFFAKEFIKDTFSIDFVPEKVKKIKFSSVIKPDMPVNLELVKKETSVEFKYFGKDKIFSSGTFVL